jgi:hypothetical protein
MNLPQQATTEQPAQTVWPVSVIDRTINDPVALFTLALVVSTILLWRATLRLARGARESANEQRDKMERSIEAAGRAADAAVDQARIADDTAKRELRAYLCLQPVRMDEILPGTQPVRIVFPLENTGATPANRFIIHWAWQVTAEEPTCEFFSNTLAQYPLTENRDHSIGPRQLKDIPNTISLSSPWREQVLNGQSKLYVLGQIRYVDVFGSERVTEFFYCYTTDLPNRLGQVKFHNKIG